MVKKSLFAALGVIGLVAAGTAGLSTPAAAGGCGAWNNWCAPRCGAWNDWCGKACGPWNRWCAAYYRYPGYSFYFGYAPKYWGYDRRHYAYKHHGKPGKYGKYGKPKRKHGGHHRRYR